MLLLSNNNNKNSNYYKMSPTVFRYKGFRFFFFSRKESRKHVHVYCSEGEAKIWLEPEVGPANNYGIAKSQLNEVIKIVRNHQNEIKDA
jgi:hypothetical protein